MGQRNRGACGRAWALFGSVGLVVLVMLGSAVVPPSQPARAEVALLGSPIATGSGPTNVAANPGLNRIYVANQGAGTVSVLDARTNAKLGDITIPGGSGVRGVAVNPQTHTVYLTQNNTNKIHLIDGQAGALGQLSPTSIDTTPEGTGPAGVAVNPNTSRVYVTLQSSNKLLMIDGTTITSGHTLVGSVPVAVAVNPNSSPIKVYIANVGGGGSLEIRNGTTGDSINQVLGVQAVDVAYNPTNDRVYVAGMGGEVSVRNGTTDAFVTNIVVADTPFGIAVNPAANRIYVARQGINSVSVIDGRTDTLDGSAITVGAAPGGMAVNQASGFVYVANNGDANVSVLGVPHLAESIKGTLSAGTDPTGVAVNPNTNRIYVANSTSQNATVIDGSTGSPASGSPIGIGGTVHGVAVDPDRNRVYVTNRTGNALAVLDGASNTGLGSIPLGANTGPRGVAVDTVNNLIYVANGDDNVTTGRSVAVIAGGTGANPGTLSTTIPSPPAGPTSFFQLEGLAVNPNSRRVYVTTRSVASSRVPVINLSSNQVISAVDVGTGSSSAAINLTTNRLYVATSVVRRLDVVNIAGDANANVATVNTGAEPVAVAVNTATNKIYVANGGMSTFGNGQSISVIDGVTNTVLGSVIPAGGASTSLAVNPKTNRAYVTVGGGVGVLAIGPTFSSPSQVAQGGSAQVTWDNLFGTHASDKIDLFPAGAASSASPASVVSSNGLAEGTVNLAIPANQAPGSYEVRLVSGHTSQALGSLELKVLGVPVANADPSYSVVAGGTLTVPAASGVLANDADADNLATLQAQVVSQPASGTLSNFQANGSFTYTPPPNVTGPVTFSYKATDADSLQSNTATVTITITGQRPAAANDAYTVTSGIDLSVSAADGLLKNDTDADTASLALTVAALTQPTGGTLSLQPTGAFIYNPRSGFSGTDSFTYRVTDSQGLTSNVATASITVNAVTIPVTNPVACGPRPTVVVQTQVVGGALQATLTATDTNAPNNRLQSIQFGVLDEAANAQVTLNGQAVASGQVVTLPANTTTQTFTVRRASAGATTTVPFTAVDTCGTWPSLVGGGAGAGF